MGSTYTPPALKPVRMAAAVVTAPVRANQRIGHQVITFFQAMLAIPFALGNYRQEVLRLTADIGWGNGSLVVGGGTIGVVAALCGFGGITVGMESFTALNLLTMTPLTGAISGFATTRELAPVIATLAFAIQAGCRFTAQLGAMRISEEIDALESLAIRPLPYLISTRMIASTLTIIPLYSVGLATAYLATKLSVLILGGTTAGTYDHYFFQFLLGPDVFWSLLKVMVFVMISTFIQCYYGYVATGGPEGVGVAAGQAIKMVIVVMVFVNLFLTLAIWGIDPGFRISG
ncbi:ABC transporter permease [Nocardia aurantiaca]|uniref:ABC transporter permease n=1 Tax=Nocardia aurantiaca TaxID=2675850 RepID=A0A6I3KYX0_9NOCA|nr:ABC transporter permease [Nocardia aurantiaca]MTE15242.1 ABC transporter permease [Nocardia aurantiaca]